jgi:hypothetical protein
MTAYFEVEEVLFRVVQEQDKGVLVYLLLFNCWNLSCMVISGVAACRWKGFAGAHQSLVACFRRMEVVVECTFVYLQTF